MILGFYLMGWVKLIVNSSSNIILFFLKIEVIQNFGMQKWNNKWNQV